jgi:hypothetical protein
MASKKLTSLLDRNSTSTEMLARKTSGLLNIYFVADGISSKRGLMRESKTFTDSDEECALLTVLRRLLHYGEGHEMTE